MAPWAGFPWGKSWALGVGARVIISAFVRGELSQDGVGQQRLLVDGRGLWYLPLLWPRVSIARTCECCDRFGMQEASHLPNLFIISSQLPRVPRFCSTEEEGNGIGTGKQLTITDLLFLRNKPFFFPFACPLLLLWETE